MLKYRVATAVVLAPLLIGSLYVLPNLQLALLLGVFTLVGAWEWSVLCGIQRLQLRVLFILAVAVTAGLLYGNPKLLMPVLVITLVWWLWALVSLRNGHEGMMGSGEPHSTVRWGCLLNGIFFLIPAWYALVSLHGSGSGATLTLFLLCIVWIADTVAFFAGRVWGKVKLAPEISPGKTLEGLVGGIVGVISFSVVSGILFWGYEGWLLTAWILICGVTGLFSVLGDLVESKLKRSAGAKDSGGILPGHGGILDRTDSISAAAPIFVLGWIALHPAT